MNTVLFVSIIWDTDYYGDLLTRAGFDLFAGALCLLADGNLLFLVHTR